MANNRGKSPQEKRIYNVLREYKGANVDFASLGVLGAHAVGIGRKWVAGKATDQLCLRYYVAKKRPIASLSAAERVPETVRFQSRQRKRALSLTTDVIETPPARFEDVDPGTRIRPVPGGVSAGTSLQTGTLGGWVWDTLDDTIVLLSNEHVLGHTPGVEIIQQGYRDGGALPADRIGEVKRGIPRSATELNTVDCAVGDPDRGALHDLRVLEIGPAVYAVDLAAVDLLVEKYSQTTRHTFGEITDADWTGRVGDRRFDDCCRVDAVAPSRDWSSGGDSGALVFAQCPVCDDSEVKPAVGLHFAGADTYGMLCKIQNVFAKLSLTTLAAGAFTSFVDGLFEAESNGQVGAETEARLRNVAALAGRPPRFSPLPFTRRDKEQCCAGRFTAGISRELQERLARGRGGRVLNEFVDGNQPELLDLLTRNGDVRRATVAALKPLLAGAVTTTDVLERVLTDEDLNALRKLARELSRQASERLKAALQPVRALGAKAEGMSLAEILRIKV